MAVKARTTVTLASIRDISSTTRYYLLQSSTAQAPSKPTANPPGGSWTRTEPSYTTGSTNSLYFTDLTVFTDGDFAYSDVCLSSSYEAAKVAYNKAVTAQESIDGLELGGRNLLRGTNEYKYVSTRLWERAEWYISSGGNGTGQVNDITDAPVPGIRKSFSVLNNTTGNRDIGEAQIPFTAGDEYTVSGYVRLTNGCTSANMLVRLYTTSAQFQLYKKITNTEWEHFHVTGVVNSVGSYNSCIFGLAGAGSIEYCAVKLEKGNRASAWTPAPEDAEDAIGKVASDLASFMDASEIIVGTQTAVTGAWTGVAGFSELKDGQQIAYWLPYAGSGSATLNLTLKGGGTTGAKNVYYRGATRATTHFVAGTVIHLTYRVNANVAGTAYTGWWADASYDSGNTYNKLRFEQSIKAKTAISASRFIVGDSGGFFHLAAGSTFDITKPILWAVAAIAAGATGTNNLLAAQSLTLRNNLGGITLTQYETCYLVGTLSGKNFTVRSSNFFTSTVPTSDDGYYYISLGYLATAFQIYLYPEHPIYKFVNGVFMSLDQVAYEAQVNVDSLEQTFTETKAEIKQTTDAISLEVSKKVGNTEIISKINQSAEAVTIDAAKVGLTAGTLAINVGTLKVQGNDIPTSITNAGKTAKNHLYYSSAKGLVVAGSAPASDSAVNSMTSYNSRVTSTGFDVYKNGSTRVAHFGEETTVGQTGSSQQVIDSTSLKFNASNGQTNLLIDNNISGHGTVRERYIEVSEDRTYNNANGTLNKGTLATLVHGIVSAKVMQSDEADYVVGATSSTVTMKVKLRGYAMSGGSSTLEYSYEEEVGTTVSLSNGHLTVQAATTAVSYWNDLVNGFADRFPSGSADYWIWIDFEIIYPVTGVAMTVGSRDPESESGAGSVSMGRNNVASGTCSVALGKDLKVTDDYSVAVGELNVDVENANTGEHMETAFAVGAGGRTPFAVLKNGTILMSSVNSGKYPDTTMAAYSRNEFTVTFESEYPSTPFIFLTLNEDNVPNKQADIIDYGRMQIYLKNVTTTDFTVTVVNGSDTSHTFGFSWFAICTYG